MENIFYNELGDRIDSLSMLSFLYRCLLHQPVFKCRVITHKMKEFDTLQYIHDDAFCPKSDHMHLTTQKKEWLWKNTESIFFFFFWGVVGGTRLCKFIITKTEFSRLHVDSIYIQHRLYLLWLYTVKCSVCYYLKNTVCLFMCRKGCM